MNEQELRIGDAERTAAADELAEHYAQGRLSTEEHHERLDRIWAARTSSDLAPVFADLPGSTHRWRPTYARADRLGAGSDWHRGSRPLAGPARRVAMLPVALKVVLALVLAVLVIAHLPLIALGVVLWLVLTHKHRRWQTYRARC